MRKDIFFILILFSTFAFSQNKSAAILPFTYSGDLDEKTANAITSFVQNAFVNTSNYKITERNQINKIIEEQNLQNTGLTEDAVRIGKIISCELVITGNIIKLGSQFTLIINLIDVETGQILKSEKKSAKIPLEDIDEVLVEPMVQSMLSGKPRTGFTLTLQRCIDLYKMDIFSDTDAWIQLSVGDRFIGKTDIIQDNNSPVFNKSFDIDDYSGEIIILTVYDHDITKDEILGQAIIKEPISGIYEIRGDINGVNSIKGQIKITIK
ncbi:MAG TPA: CsgG/HfaB family protein [Candidatus Lokiarchaeia archaeon]